jgi:hypothetical protein
MACSGAGGGDVLWVKRSRSRANRSSGIEGEVVVVTTCSGGEAIEGALHRWWHASSIGSIEDLKRASGENLLSVEQATRAPDIYIGGQLRDARSLRRVAHFFRCVAHYF